MRLRKAKATAGNKASPAMKGWEDIFREFDLESPERTVALKASTALALMLRRVFVLGKDAKGTPILGGSYSRKPYYAHVDQFIRKPSIKPSKGGFISLPGGYEQFRQLSGRRTDIVDLDYTSALRQSLRFRITPRGFVLEIVGGGAGESIPDSGRRATSVEKADYAESAHGSDIFILSDEEINLL